MIRAEGIRCGYGHRTVLKGISFGAGRGEILGIIGPNGSGKTTVLRTLSRIINTEEGRILLDGRDIEEYSYKELARRVAVVSQSSGFGYIKVEEYVLLGRIPYYGKMQLMESAADRETADRYMALTDIGRIRGSFMHEVSGGEKQLAFICRALCQEPMLLLMDEPTAHLDITHQTGILDLVKRLRRELALTVIIVLHDLNLAGEYCDRLILLNGGKIHSAGTPEEVLTYQNIEEVYKTVVVVKKNPVSGRPNILAVSEEARKRGKS
ncbi:MAG: ABC transporter ATP-binding protein [Elusimicrobia bacterium]|nr:ABC transporter ATP-binding protein [Elusimicrobiota bacterium]